MCPAQGQNFLLASQCPKGQLEAVITENYIGRSTFQEKLLLKVPLHCSRTVRLLVERLADYLKKIATEVMTEHEVYYVQALGGLLHRKAGQHSLWCPLHNEMITECVVRVVRLPRGFFLFIKFPSFVSPRMLQFAWLFISLIYTFTASYSWVFIFICGCIHSHVWWPVRHKLAAAVS